MHRLDASIERRLRDAELTSPRSEAGRPPPAGHDLLRMHRVVSADRDRFDVVADGLMAWEVHSRSGLDVRASAEVAAVDEVVVLRTRIGPVRIDAPCRVVAVVDEADARGFTYATLPGHPESGEETFLVERSSEGVLVTVSAFSRPASLPARAAASFARRMQVRQTQRYLDAAQRLAD